MSKPTKPLRIYSIRAVKRVAGIDDNQPSFHVAAPSRAAAIRAFDAAKVRVSVTDLKNYGNDWPLEQRPAHAPSLAAMAEPGVVFAAHGVTRGNGEVVVRVPSPA